MALNLIDVSKHQGKIDWAQAKDHIDGAIIRCGYGRDIKSQDDARFKANVEACIKYGIPFGVYIYSYANDIEGAESEANHVLRLLAPYKGKLSYPVYYDLEEAGTEKTAVERAIRFGDIIESKGYWCGIYANQYWWRTYLKDKLNRFTKWVAKYSDNEPSGISGTYDIWQYSSKGIISGINGVVDMNICYRNFPAEIKGNKKVEYYPQYKETLIVVLDSLGVDSSYSFREKIAGANGISDYTGTAEQNTKLLNLLKEGKLIKP